MTSSIIETMPQKKTLEDSKHLQQKNIKTGINIRIYTCKTATCYEIVLYYSIMTFHTRDVAHRYDVWEQGATKGIAGYKKNEFGER